ncbi:MAG TPA: GatB/YqeY domain-containing protein [Ktedonobacterales bacterium]|nr:GatB/YqeY domain-containing protein [Ktedonobacterales bacterium]
MAEANSSELETRLRADVQNAQRQRDQVLLDTLRLALNAFHLEEVARTDRDNPNHGKALTEQDRLNLLDKQVKQRNEAAALFRQGNRPALAEKEEREAAILQAYLPARLTDDELRQIVSNLVAANGRDFKKVMPLAAKETKGRADGSRVQQIVRELTS